MKNLFWNPYIFANLRYFKIWLFDTLKYQNIRLWKCKEKRLENLSLRRVISYFTNCNTLFLDYVINMWIVLSDTKKNYCIYCTAVFDKDMSGFVSSSELKYVMSQLGVNFSDEEIIEMIIEVTNIMVWLSFYFLFFLICNNDRSLPSQTPRWG